jgi:hypothetical protein
VIGRGRCDNRPLFQTHDLGLTLFVEHDVGTRDIVMPDLVLVASAIPLASMHEPRSFVIANHSICGEELQGDFASKFGSRGLIAQDPTPGCHVKPAFKLSWV